MDLEAARARAEAMMARFERLQDGYAELRDKLLAVTATVTSADELVTATVGPRGQLVDLELSPRIYRRPDSRRLSEVITATIQQAATEALDQVTELTRPFVPDEKLQAYMDLDLERAQRSDHELLGRDTP